MNEEIKSILTDVQNVLTEVRVLSNANSIISFDRLTICPKGSCQREDEISEYLSSKIFMLKKNEMFVNNVATLSQHKNELCNKDKRLISLIADSLTKSKSITPLQFSQYIQLSNKSYIDWLEAKEKNDFSLFAGDLSEIIKFNKKFYQECSLKFASPYDYSLDDYEKDLTTAVLDKFFSELKTGITEILTKISTSKKIIRNDFLLRKVDISKQEKFSHYLLDLIGFDFNRGMLSSTEHPFTSSLSFSDVRVTTHYYENLFISNIFSTIHEGGHAIFSQNLPIEDYKHNLEGNQTMSMDESISRFYENIIGRSESFIHLIYPEFIKQFNEFADVSEKELYEAVNIAEPSLIRTEADELTYGIHIIIRYELEKRMMNEELDINEIPKLWNALYTELLGVTPKGDSDGVLQDVHWSSGFGYFPSYALGNAYGAMIYQKMNKDINVNEIIASGNLIAIRDYLRDHVFLKSSELTPAEWIKDITGKELSSEAFINYLKEKYYKLYEVK